LVHGALEQYWYVPDTLGHVENGLQHVEKLIYYHTMLRINLKIQFVLLLISLFFVGWGIENILEEGFISWTYLFKQISHIVPFLISSFVFIWNIYYKKNENQK
jgi:hypothetical protein